MHCLWIQIGSVWCGLCWLGCSSIFTLKQFVFEMVENSLNWYNFNCTGAKTVQNSLIYVEHKEHTSLITVVAMHLLSSRGYWNKVCWAFRAGQK